MIVMGKILDEHAAASYILKFVSLLLSNFNFNGLLFGFFFKYFEFLFKNI